MNMTPRRAWLILLGMQVLVALVVFSSFLSGKVYFAFLDIGSDSYGQVVPSLMYMARMIADGRWFGWAFEIGLGSPTALMTNDLFIVLNALGGVDNVLPWRIWVYLLKIALGGAAFFMLVRCVVTRWEAAVICALAYSFCGYVVINGQWDGESTAFVFFPLVLWGIFRAVVQGKFTAFPVTVALALLSGVFFVGMSVFLAMTGLAFIACARQPRAMFRVWLLRMLPLAVVGYLLAAPQLLPTVLQVLDSSRVGGGDTLFQKMLQQGLSINDSSLILTEIGGLFHKDIFGIGNAYQGYWNYLEGPGFFIGVALLLLTPQLLAGSARDKRVFWLTMAMVAAYFVFPVFRYAAMGFAVPYFRVSTLWVSLALLLLAARAVDQVLQRGVNARMLVVGVGGYGLLLGVVALGSLSEAVSITHVSKIMSLAVLSGLVLWLAQRHLLSARALPLALLGLVAIESVLIARPSYVQDRRLVTASIHSQVYNDGTREALQAIRRNDSGWFRIEKTYITLSPAEAMSQNYMGVKAYSLNSRGLVDFYIGMDLIPASSEGQAVNYTNWLPNAGSRSALNSLLGVKYIIAKEALQWPGFTQVSQSPGQTIYFNQLALPLGIVQTRQVTQAALSRLSSLPAVEANSLRDITLINAVVVPDLNAGQGESLTYEDVLRFKNTPLDDSYVKPALDLQATGLQIETFANTHISGTVSPRKAGMLVFSIPFNQGWSLTVDGQATPLQRANFGMLAAPVQAGSHKVVLDFELPGRRAGGWLGALGLGLLALVVAITRRRKASPQLDAVS
jgi:uncharacterized membrane protein YfhO